MPEKLSLWQKIALAKKYLPKIDEFWPLFEIGQKLVGEDSYHGKATAAMNAIEWLSDKTATEIDDKYAPLVAAVLAEESTKKLIDAIQADMKAAEVVS
jgi:hypothetical protein